LQHVIILENLFIFVAYLLSQDLLTATGQLVSTLSVLRPFQPWPN